MIEQIIAEYIMSLRVKVNKVIQHQHICKQTLHECVSHECTFTINSVRQNK